MIINSIPWCRAGRAQGAQILYFFFDALGGCCPPIYHKIQCKYVTAW